MRVVMSTVLLKHWFKNSTGSIIQGTGGAGGPPRRELRGSSMGRGLKAAVVPMFGGRGQHWPCRGEKKRAPPGACAPGLGNGLGGKGGNLKLPRRAGAGPGPRATHLWIPSESLPKTWASSLHLELQPAPPSPPPGIQRFKTWATNPIHLDLSFPGLKLPGRQRSPLPHLLPDTHTSHTIGSRLEKSQSSSKTFTEAGGRAGARAIRRAELGGVGEVGRAGREKAL